MSGIGYVSMTGGWLLVRGSGPAGRALPSALGMRDMERAAVSGARRMFERSGRAWPLLGWAAAVFLAPAELRAEIPYEREPIRYLTAQTTDPVARLKQRLQRGEA